jgi:hypothetical protein
VTKMPHDQTALDQRGANRRHRWLALLVLAGAMVPTIIGAQPTSAPTTVIKSALNSVFSGHFLLLTVIDVGSPNAVSEVTIEFRDGADQRQAFTSGLLTGRRPLKLRATIPAGVARGELRAIVRRTLLTDGFTSELIVGLEDIDNNAFRIETKPPCAPEPSVGGGAEGNCGGWSVTHIAQQSAGTSLD